MGRLRFDKRCMSVWAEIYRHLVQLSEVFWREGLMKVLRGRPSRANNPLFHAWKPCNREGGRMKSVDDRFGQSEAVVETEDDFARFYRTDPRAPNEEEQKAGEENSNVKVAGTGLPQSTGYYLWVKNGNVVGCRKWSVARMIEVRTNPKSVC